MNTQPIRTLTYPSGAAGARSASGEALTAQASEQRRGSAIVPTLVVISALAVFAVALLTTGINGAKAVNHQTDEYRLASAVESLGVLAVDRLWSEYLESEGGAAGNILSFRSYLDSIEIQDMGPGGAPSAEEGVDFVPLLGLPLGLDGDPEFDHVNVDAVQILRRDEGSSTQLFLTVSASSNFGNGIMNPVLNRAIQQVYTIEPADFEGFDYGILANNVNCIFCHTQVDSVERYYDLDGALASDKVKVGTLQSLVLRHDMDGPGGYGQINDFDADSYVAGSVYVRGKAVQHDGSPIGPSDWEDQSLKGWAFDANGKIVEGPDGLEITSLSPSPEPHVPGENLYLDYPDQYKDMVDGKLPPHFPPPIPDDGGWDASVGGPAPGAAGNKVVDDAEFAMLSASALGWVTSGNMTVLGEGATIDNELEYLTSLTGSNVDSMHGTVDGNVVLTGTYTNPIKIQGTVAVDGDLILSGYVQGEGSFVVRGNVYVPSDLQYLDGQEYLPGDLEGLPTGPRTFGIAPDGTKNAMGVASGGNIVVGDYLAPSQLDASFQTQLNAPGEVVTGDTDGKWNFALAELSLFNRDEWSKTQPKLPKNLLEAFGPPEGWTGTNASYEPGYVPRYYNFGEEQTIPIFNKGLQWFDESVQSWIAFNPAQEMPMGWNPGELQPGQFEMLTELDPTDPSNPYLFDVAGNAIAAISSLSPEAGWVTSEMYKKGLDFFHALHPNGAPVALDGLYYTNNAIFGIVDREGKAGGSMIVNGALVAADLGLLLPGSVKPGTAGTIYNTPGSPYGVGLQLNYDKRVKEMLNVANPYQVTIKRTLWRPTANML